ncbi:hypothetical protein [Ramlibacter albus]|uniref:Transmembrane protein n=1 Tax=Ramlibacter albus TaxID=2079448 RepID=A0A923M5Y9_9BURK|nr:hypothetical protein [Ramlibacter albus]MBC5763528.1 hypothetical protein [Ramlibacter albus]
MGRQLLHALTRVIARLAAWPLALLILFEEWGWEPLQRALLRLAKFLHLEWLEARIRELPPYAALVLFIAPSLLLLPVKLLALWLVGQGRMLLGTLVIVAAKIVGTAIVARLFTLTKPALMRLAWFERAYNAWITWKAALLAIVRESWPWRWARVVKRRWRRALARRGA